VLAASTIGITQDARDTRDHAGRGSRCEQHAIPQDTSAVTGLRMEPRAATSAQVVIGISAR